MQPAHLIIVIHGLYGDIHNLHAVKSELLALCEPRSANGQKGDVGHDDDGMQGTEAGEPRELETVIYLPTTISGAKTWDGIDVCAHRVAEEVDREIERLQDEGRDVVGFSVMGYSLGGLIARYLIGLLHARQPSFFLRHRPVSFSTAATPHLGVLKYGTRTNRFVHTIGRQLFSQTGRQLYCRDKEAEWGGRSLLEAMADPNNDFIQALRLFPKTMLVANGSQDFTVPFPTATISPVDPFADPSLVDIEVDEHHIVQSYKLVRPESYGPLDNVAENNLGEIDADGEEVTVTVKTTTRRAASTVGPAGRLPPLVPPVLVLSSLRWPFNYSLLLLVPFLAPIALLYLIVMFPIHTIQSQRRIRVLQDVVERRPLLSSAFLTSPASADPSTAPTSSPLPLTHTLPVVDYLSHSDGTCTPPMADPPPMSSGAPLLLTAAQKAMIKNLNEAMPQAKRVIAWFPWAYSSHAMLICRAASRFPWQEDGRGVVRTWTRYVHEAGEVVCRARSGGGVAHGNVR